MVTREQLLGLGLGVKAIDHRARCGRLAAVHRGVYLIGGAPTTPLQRAAAAVLACGPHAGLSHTSALWLWGLHRTWATPVHVILSHGDRRPAGVATHRARLHRRDLTMQRGVRATTPARTLLDCAPGLTDRALTRAVNDARLAYILTSDQLADVLLRYRHHPGAARLRLHADSAQGPTRSVLEDEFLAFCAAHGLPTPDVNARVCGLEVDALFREARLIVELDSWRHHGDRAAFERDRERDALTTEAGYRTVRLTAQRLRHEPEREAARLHRLTRRPPG